ncbi:hypothetical protein [Ruania halotolerans]|nr:hypothetical protein [Ruania halotolerans]
MVSPGEGAGPKRWRMRARFADPSAPPVLLLRRPADAVGLLDALG